MNVQPVSEAELQKERDRIFNAFTIMLNTDGWKEFEQYMKNEEIMTEQSLMKARTGDACLEAKTALTVIRAMRNYPLMIVKHEQEQRDAESKAALEKQAQSKQLKK